MCGIAGVFGEGDETTVRRMLARLRHRGPDDEHIVCGKEFCLGARRLAIVDLKGGRQPIGNENADVWGAFNGEIYNFPELRTELLARGHRLKTTCDTEVLPHLYEELGEHLPDELDGMFSLSVWDDRSGRGLLARDRMGKKPLYYHVFGQQLYFASEIKALLEIPGFQRRINRSALVDYLSLKHVPCPTSIFEGIFQIPPAHRLRYEVGKPPIVERYWSIEESPPPAPADEAEAVDRLLALLRLAVRKRLHADVPIGFFLSGGLDSSLLVALAAEYSNSAFDAFTLVYSDSSTTPGKESDKYWADQVAKKFGVRRHEASLGAGDLPQSLLRIVCSFDEPFAGVVSTYFLASLMSKHVKTAVSGDGADELFGSYLSHRLAQPLHRFPEYRTVGDPLLLGEFADQSAWMSELYEPNDWIWRSKLSVFSDEEKRELLSFQDVGRPIREYWREVFGRLHATDPLNRVLLAEFATQLPDQVLCFVDRLSMAHSLEIRCPFLDAGLATFAASLPGDWKIHHGRTKHLLKEAARQFFPPAMIDRPKEGFVLPIARWLATSLREFTRDVLHPTRLARHGLFDPSVVVRWIDTMEMQPDDYRVANKVYSILMFQLWHEEYL